jgi:PAS domain S-box-containing protein
MVAAPDDFRLLRAEGPTRVLTAVLDALPLSLYVVDRALRVVAWNRYRETGPLGRPRSEVLGRPLEEVLPPEGFANVLPSLQRVFETAVALEETAETSQGARTFRTWRLPVLMGSEVTHVVSLFEDVTERRLLEEQFWQAQTMDAMEQLTGAIARHVGDALREVSRHAQSLLYGLEEKDGRREHVRAILGEVERASGVPQQLLAFGGKQFLRGAAAEPAAESRETPVAVHGAALSGGTETILLAEDQEAVRMLARKVLERWGYRVLEASHGLEALEIARRHDGPIHLLLTDLGMPYMGGDELARNEYHARPHTRVLVISAREEGPLPPGHPVPGAAFMCKPFTLGSLARKVRQVLDAPAVEATA